MLSVLKVRLESYYEGKIINASEVEASFYGVRCFDFGGCLSIQTYWAFSSFVKSLSMTKGGEVENNYLNIS
jgi:hypothetical protein